MHDFIAEGRQLWLGQTRNRLEVGWVACNQRASLQLRHDIGHIVLASELLHIVDDLRLVQVGEGILDPGFILASSTNAISKYVSPGAAMKKIDVHILSRDVVLQAHLLVMTFLGAIGIIARALMCKYEAENRV